MWLIFCCLIIIWLFTSIILNITKIFDYFEMKKSSVKLAELYDNLKNEGLAECEPIGKHAKEE